ncbi:SUKH-3 domain-containing protein [Streptomyces sp. NPDC057555]|uniref:SUKH-3 domain-containing protein n=1 Tax=Streptomyces sp. NPDC057555 TaxID=3346166 RepID=UPI00367E1636
MSVSMSRDEVLQWLTRNGWSPDRNVEEKAREFISEVVAESEEEGFPAVLFEVALSFITTYGLLKLTHPTDSDSSLITNPTGGYEGDFSEIDELSQELEKRLFRVGYDLPDGGIFVVAEDGEFYCIHHTGAYYLGSDEFEFFSNWVKGDLQSV